MSGMGEHGVSPFHRVPWVVSIAVLAAGLLACAGAPVVLAAEHAESGKLTVLIENLRSDKGIVRVALWKGKKGFTKAEVAIAKLKARPENGAVSFTFGDLAPGRYALATFHDENANGKLDKTWIGWPKEGLGFSNGAWINVLGAPPFKKAAVEVAPGAKSIVIPLRY
jgi:uncharacterized protein (DUF2141 family)